jgi:hypothetical protein
MGPFGITVLVSVTVLFLGTVVGAVMLALGQLAMRGARPVVLPLLGAAFGGTCLALFVFTIAWWLLDETSRPVAGPPLILSAIAGGLMSFFIASPRLDVQARFMGPAWASFGIFLILLLCGTGLIIHTWREASGFFRGFERLHSYNMLEPRDAMATPTQAVKYYNQQYGLLRTANEDRGWGRILTTQSRFDARWFIENDQWINEHSSKSDRTGIGKVIQDPRAIRVMALSQLARPVFGEVVEEKIIGDQALVRTDEGQVVRLLKEGPHWKIYGWLGHRFAMMEEIYPTKKEKEGLTPGDEAEAALGWTSYETETEELARQAGLAYLPSSSFAEESVDDPKTAGKPIARGGMIRRRSRTGYARLDLAPPGVLVDLSGDEKVEFIDVPANPGRTPGNAAGRPSTIRAPSPPSPAATADLKPQSNSSTTASSSPVPALSGDPPPGNATATRQWVPPNPAGGAQPIPLAPLPPDRMDPAAPLIAGLFEPGNQAVVPLAGFWPVYFDAVEGLQRDQAKSVTAFLALLSNEDRLWLQRNARLMSMIVTPEAATWSEQQTLLVASQLLIRNMPRTRIPAERIRMWQKQSTALVRMVERIDGRADQTYTTLVRVERGQWVLVHPFWARTLIWTPQLAQARRAFNLPLTLDELSYIQSGLGPMQAFLRNVFSNLGYTPG